MRWPWNRNRELEQAVREKENAETREREIRPLAKRLEKHDRVNHFAARFRAAGLGGE